MIVLPQSIVSQGEVMYQSAFLSLEFSLTSELVSSVVKHKFKKFFKKKEKEIRYFDSLGLSFLERFHFLNGSFWKMPDFVFNLGRFERKIQKKKKKNSKKINKNLNDLKLIFLELVHLYLCSGKVWENRFFSKKNTEHA